MLALLMEAEDENGGKLGDEEIVDLLIIYLYAGHESSALATMWVLMFLEQHPQVYQKAKVNTKLTIYVHIYLMLCNQLISIVLTKFIYNFRKSKRTL